MILRDIKKLNKFLFVLPSFAFSDVLCNALHMAASNWLMSITNLFFGSASNRSLTKSAKSTDNCQTSNFVNGKLESSVMPYPFLSSGYEYVQDAPRVR